MKDKGLIQVEEPVLRTVTYDAAVIALGKQAGSTEKQRVLGEIKYKEQTTDQMLTIRITSRHIFILDEDMKIT